MAAKRRGVYPHARIRVNILDESSRLETGRNIWISACRETGYFSRVWNHRTDSTTTISPEQTPFSRAVDRHKLKCYRKTVRAREKLLRRMRESPRSISFEEVDALLKSDGWRVVNVTGSHFLYDKQGRKMLVVKPHGFHKTLHPKGVKKILKVLTEGQEE